MSESFADERTARKVNPIAWDKGLGLAQCSGCGAWHKLRDAGNLVEVPVFCFRAAKRLGG